MSFHEFKRSKPKDWSGEELTIHDIPAGMTSHGSIDVFEDRLGGRLKIPVIAIKGEQEGPVLGITAAVHGNEINGIPVIHRLHNVVDPQKIKGTVIAVPIVNLPGYLAYQREFIDGVDLNRIMPGKDPGTPSEVYAFHFVNRILSKFNYHLDLHTASFGRINSHYIRADLTNEMTLQMALLQHADIIVHATEPPRSVRSSAMDLGIPSITVELGNPQVFQQQITHDAMKSVRNVLTHLDMLDGMITRPAKKPAICSRSYWTRVHDGGVLKVLPRLTQIVDQGQDIAELYDIYGRHEITYQTPERGIVIGKNVNPVVSSGDRILHLGILDDEIIPRETPL